MNKLYIIVFLIILILFLIYKKKEKFTTSSEAVQYLAQYMYNTNNTLNIKNMNSTGTIKANNIDVSGSLTIKNTLNANNIDVSGSLTIKNTLNANNGLILNGTDIRYYTTGVTLMAIYLPEFESSNGTNSRDPGVLGANSSNILHLPVGVWRLQNGSLQYTFNNNTTHIILNPGFGVELYDEQYGVKSNTDGGGYIKVINYGTKPARFKLTQGSGNTAVTLEDFQTNSFTGSTVPSIKDFLNTDLDTIHMEGIYPSGSIMGKVSFVYVFLADDKLWASHTKEDSTI